MGFYLNTFDGTGEMTWGCKYLLYNHKDLNLNLQNPCSYNHWTGLFIAVMSVLWGQGLEVPRSLLDSLPSQHSKCPVQRETHSQGNKMESDTEGNLVPSSSSRRHVWGVNTCTRTNTHLTLSHLQTKTRYGVFEHERRRRKRQQKWEGWQKWIRGENAWNTLCTHTKRHDKTHFTQNQYMPIKLLNAFEIIHCEYIEWLHRLFSCTMI